MYVYIRQLCKFWYSDVVVPALLNIIFSFAALVFWPVVDEVAVGLLDDVETPEQWLPFHGLCAVCARPFE
jgi:hypothetical protein